MQSLSLIEKNDPSQICIKTAKKTFTDVFLQQDLASWLCKYLTLQETMCKFPLLSKKFLQMSQQIKKVDSVWIDKLKNEWVNRRDDARATSWFKDADSSDEAQISYLQSYPQIIAVIQDYVNRYNLGATDTVLIFDVLIYGMKK